MFSRVLLCFKKVTFFTSKDKGINIEGEGSGTSLQYFFLENPMDRGAWWAAVHGVATVGQDWATSLSLFTFMHWRRKWQPTPVFLPGESQGLEVWWAAVYGVAQSRTRLKQHSINIVTLTKILLDFLKCQCCKNFKKYLILYVINTWIKYLQHWSKFTTKPAICNCVELYENSNLEVYLYLIPRLFILAM